MFIDIQEDSIKMKRLGKYIKIFGRNFKMKKFISPIIKLCDVLLAVLPFVAAWFAYYKPYAIGAHNYKLTLVMLIGYAVVFYYVAYRLEGFQLNIRRISELISGQVIALMFTNACAVVAIWSISEHFPDLVLATLIFIVQTVIVCFSCKYSHMLFFSVYPPKKTVIIYGLRHGMDRLITAFGLEKRFNIIGNYSTKEVMQNPGESYKDILNSKLGTAEHVFVCCVKSHNRNLILKYCIEHNIPVSAIPHIGDLIVSTAERQHMLRLPFLYVKRYKPDILFLIVKRMLDIILSALGLIVLSPAMLAIAICVMSDGGPAFYKQVRLTKDRKQFTLLKFRSMCVDAEKYTGAVLSSGANDTRITKVGRVLRSYRLDELPQLWNILVGDMSIVGPRPERPELAAEIEKGFPEFALRLQCKAGLTGYAQVYGKYNTDPYDKTLMDLMYIAHPSLLEDLTIILETVKTIFDKDSTEGVGEDSIKLPYEPENDGNE